MSSVLFNVELSRWYTLFSCAEHKILVMLAMAMLILITAHFRLLNKGGKKKVDGCNSLVGLHLVVPDHA